MTNSCEISGIEPIFLYHSERFKSLYYWLWFLWISKCTKSDVWTMHVFPIQLHIWPACAKSLTDNTSLQVGSIKKIMKYTMKIYGEVNTSVEGKHHIFCFLNSTWCTAKKTAMGSQENCYGGHQLNCAATLHIQKMLVLTCLFKEQHTDEHMVNWMLPFHHDIQMKKYL